MSRIRSTSSDVRVVPTKHDCWYGSVHNYYNDHAVAITPSFERIIDDGGPVRFVSGKVAYKNVDHVKFTADFGGSVVWHYSTPLCDCRHDCLQIGSLVAFGGNVSQLPNMSEWCLSYLQSKLPSPLGYQADLWEQCKPTMTTRANLFVFLYELRDIKRMFDVIPKRHLRSKDGKSFKDWRSALKYANEQHLNYSFGWRPFLADLRNFRKALGSWRERLVKLVNNQNLDLNRGARKSISVSGEEIISYGALRLKVILECEPTISARFMFRYCLPDMPDEELVLRALADSLGANFTIANIWAVIPFSFVVDWFVGVQKYLDRTTTTDWIEPSLAMLQACSSLHAKGTITLFVGKSDSSTWGSLGSFSFEQYVRRVESPSYNMIQLGDLTADKVRLLASLGAARVL